MREGEPDPDAVDYYARIGVSPDADAETIERRRKQADRRFSPMGGSSDADEKRHMQINEASNVLESREERQRYDDLYDALGPIHGTLAYETLPTDIVDEIREGEMLRDHLRGFVEILGPKAGAREFQQYHDRLSTPLPSELGDADLPNGYEVEDAGFGIAAWSWYEADQPCPFSLWLTGGRQLWRMAIIDSGAIDEQLEAVRNNAPSSVDSPTESSETATADATASASDGGSPATQITLGHPSSAATSRPPSRSPTTESRSTSGSVSDEPSRVWTALGRFRNVLAYVGETTLWTGGSVAGTVGGSLVASLAVAVLLVPLLAVAMVIQSATASDITAAGLPLVSLDQPVTTESLLHYLALGLFVVVPGWVTGRYVAPWLHDRRERDLPRDAWLVFGPLLPILAGTLFVGVGQSALPQRLGLGLTVLLSVYTFLAAMDVHAPRLLSLLCQQTATFAFGVAGAVVALTAVGAGLSVADPPVFATYETMLGKLPLTEAPLFTTANAELLVVAAGALAFVPLALTTLYSLAYAVESVALRIRSRAHI